MEVTIMNDNQRICICKVEGKSLSVKTMTTSNNIEVTFDIERKLVQAISLAKVISDNHDYKDEGLEKPFIDHSDTSHLIWLLSTLLEEVLKEYLDINFKGEKSAV